MAPHLSRITIYPVKSLDGLDVAEAVVLPGGALEEDRRFAMFDARGEIVHGKRTARVHRIRLGYDPAARTLTLGLRDQPESQVFRVDDESERRAMESWLSDQVGEPVSLREAPETGFPDETGIPGPTVIATATLETVASWFAAEGFDLDDCRQRFRANLEIGGVEAFWDDRLFTRAGESVRFRVGAVAFEGVAPCPRCVVPSRSPLDGAVTRDFPRRFADLRAQALPPWAEASRLDHFYHLAVNTRRADGDGDRGRATIRVGDPVAIEPSSASNRSGLISV